MTGATKKKLAALLALGVSGGVFAYMAYGDMEKNLVYYWDPKQLIEKGEAAKNATIRLGGVVQNGTLDWQAENLNLNFKVGLQPEATGPTVAVHASGHPPQMFREGIGVVVEGRFDGKIFEADRLMVKHSNEYRPPAPGESPKDLYGTLVNEENK